MRVFQKTIKTRVYFLACDSVTELFTLVCMPKALPAIIHKSYAQNLMNSAVSNDNGLQYLFDIKQTTFLSKQII